MLRPRMRQMLLLWCFLAPSLAIFLLYRVIPVKGGTQLSTIAEMNHTSVWMLHFLNPGLLRNAVPPAESYALRVPSEGRDGQLLNTL